MIKKIFLQLSLALSTFYSLGATSYLEEFKEKGYVEIHDENQISYDSLYFHFDVFAEFLQKNKAFAQKLYVAKERFIRTSSRNLYSTDFFGFYDESEKQGKSQIAFYYCTHFHEFVSLHFKELIKIPEINTFLEECFILQKTYEKQFNEVISQLHFDELPILLKVIKYFPSYYVTKPHYDGTAFSFFLNSTDNQSLLLSPYKSSFTVEDFSSPSRGQNSILLIPGAFLTEFSIYPTPHIIAKSGKTRYATIAFAMRSNYILPKVEFSNLPNFKD